MDAVNRSAQRVSRVPHQAVFDVVRPMIRILRACGVSDSSIGSATGKARRQYVRAPAPGVRLEHVPFLELADVVMVWARDPEFIDETGSPMKLRLSGGAGSFERLLKKARVSIPAASALKQLEALGSVQLCDRGRRVRFVSNVLLMNRGNQFVVGPQLESVRRFLETIEHNLCERPSSDQGRMQRWAVCSSLEPEQLPEAQRFVRLSGQAFLEAVDDKLAACRTKPGKKAGRPYGVGIYVFIDKPHRAKSGQRASQPRDRGAT
jgi:hypothetical protein